MEEEEMPKKAIQGFRNDLETLSVEALGNYIQDLKQEIARVEALIESKKAARGLADSFFKS